MGTSKAQSAAAAAAAQQEEVQGNIPKTRDEMILYLLDHGYKNPGRYSKPELEALIQEHLNPKGHMKGPRKDPCMGLSSLTKPDLRELAELLGVKDYLSMTNGMLMLNIRHSVEALEDQQVGIGRLKGVTMQEAALQHQAYCEWAQTQMDGHPHQRLKELVALHRMYFRYYPRQKDVPQTTTSTTGTSEWPQEPEAEEHAAPRRSTKVGKESGASASHRTPTRQQSASPTRAPPQVYQLDSEGKIDEGYISDTPPAWEEKKSRVAPKQGSKRK